MSLKTAMGKKHAKLRGVLRDNKPLKTHTHHSNRVGGFVASEQAVTFLRDARALLLRSKKWTKSRHQALAKAYDRLHLHLTSDCYTGMALIDSA
jgi:hypothetical protein